MPLETVVAASHRAERLEKELKKIIRGKDEVVRLALVSVLARGHLLIETTEAQAELMMDVFGEAGLKAWIAQDEDLEATVVIGRQAES